MRRTLERSAVGYKGIFILPLRRQFNDTMPPGLNTLRLGVDLGGTKIEIIALAPDGRALLRQRTATPKKHYRAILDAVATLVRESETKLGQAGTVGIGTPGSISRATGLLRGSNS